MPRPSKYYVDIKKRETEEDKNRKQTSNVGKSVSSSLKNVKNGAERVNQARQQSTQRTSQAVRRAVDTSANAVRRTEPSAPARTNTSANTQRPVERYTDNRNNKQELQRQARERSTAQRRNQANIGKTISDNLNANEYTQSLRRNQQERQRQAEENRNRDKGRVYAKGTAEEISQKDVDRMANSGVARGLKTTFASAGSTVASHLQTLNDLTYDDGKLDNEGNRYVPMSGKQAQKELDEYNERYRKRQAYITEKKQEMENLRQSALNEANSKIEKWALQALDSGVGMTLDMAAGPAWAASMASRTYGSTRGQAMARGATEEEDKLYSLGSATLETVSEFMFPGIGLAGRLPGTGVLRGVAGELGERMGKRALGRYAKGILEEEAEEAGSFILSPWIEELTYGKNVRKRDFQGFLQQERDAVLGAMQDDVSAQSVAMFLASDEYGKSIANMYKERGVKAEDIDALTELTREYLRASISGDMARAEELEEELSNELANKSRNIEYDLRGEGLDTLMSTLIMTGTTGAPGAVVSNQVGSQAKTELGQDGMKALFTELQNSTDSDVVAKAKVFNENLANGKVPTNVQMFDMVQAKVAESEKKRNAALNVYETAEKIMRNENLTPPAAVGSDGVVYPGEKTREAIVQTSRTARGYLESLNRSNVEGGRKLSKNEIQQYAEAVAMYQSGTIAGSDSFVVAYNNTEGRAVFEAITGVNLNQYVVRDKNGDVDIAKTNANTYDAFYKGAVQNLIESARVETANEINILSGQITNEMLPAMGKAGQSAWASISKNIDSRNVRQTSLTASAVTSLYSMGRNTTINVDEALSAYSNLTRFVDESVLREAFNAGYQDRIAEETIANNQEIAIGEAISNTDPAALRKGELFNDAKVEDNELLEVMQALASGTNVNIHLVSSIDAGKDKNGKMKQGNGMYIDGEIYLNVNADAEQNLAYVVMHEMTHHLKQYAPTQYLALENLIREEWIKQSPEEMQMAIASRVELYKKAGQNLTESEAMEEIVADAMAEAMNDPLFAARVCEADVTVGKAVLNSIRSTLRKLRQVFSAKEYENDNFSKALLSRLGILEEAERLWLEAYTQAYKNRAAVGIVQWQDAVNERLSISGTTLPAKVTREDVLDELSHARHGDYNRRSFIPVRSNTPAFIVALAKYNDVKIENRPIVMPVHKAMQAMDEETNQSVSNQPHGFDEEDIVTIMERLNDPQAVYYQQDNNRIGVIVKSPNKKGRKGFAVIDFEGDTVNPDLINGYDGGVYNVAITVMNMDLDYAKSYANSEYNVLWYEKGLSQGSNIGSPVPSLFNDNPFYDDTLSSSESDVNNSLSDSEMTVQEDTSSADTDGRLSITPQQDADYMSAVESGDMETAQRMVNEAAAQAMPNTKTPGLWLHGTENEFTEFNFSQGGKNGTAEGFGIYLAKDRDVAEHYGKRMIEGFVNIEKPASSSELTISKNTLSRLIKATVEQEAERIAEDYDDDIEAAKKDTWISNYTYTYDKSIDNAISEVVDSILNMNFSDMEVVQEVMGGMAIRNYDDASSFYDTLTALTGIDGFTTTWENQALEGTRDIALAFRSEQIKDASPVTYDDDGNVIPLSERFNQANPDIRYSISDAEIQSDLENRFDEYKTDKTNLRIATEAVADLQNSRFSLTNGQQVRTIAKGITSDLVNEGYVDFIGRKVEGPEDLARMCQILRDPRFETFRYVLTKGNKIVSFRSISSRLPGTSTVVSKGSSDEAWDNEIKHIKDRMKRTGADGYYFIHNHPSGDVNASFTDQVLTIRFLNDLGQEGYKGHIILDHDQFGLIEDIPELSGGHVLPKASTRKITGQQTIDLIHQPELDHEILGTEITGAHSIATLAKSVQESEDVSVILYFDSKLRVRGAQEVSNKTLLNNKEFKNYIKNQMVEFGSTSTGLYTSDADVYKSMKQYIESKHFVDVILGEREANDITSARNEGVEPDPNYEFAGITVAEEERRRMVFESAKGVESYGADDGGRGSEESVKYSLTETDSEGTVLSDGQMDFFKNSQARDEQGRLLRLYHGTENSGFTIFDSDYGVTSRYFFFVDNNDRAKGYSGTHDIFRLSAFESVDEANAYIEEIGFDDIIAQDGDEYVVYEGTLDGEPGDELLRSADLSELMQEYLDDYQGFGGDAANYECYLNITNPLVVDAENNNWDEIPFNGDAVTSNWLAEYAESEGYDGLIIQNVMDYGIYASSAERIPQTDYIVFSSNQIKGVDNLDPTNNPDIRFSIVSEDDVMDYLASQANMDMEDIPSPDPVIEEGRVRMARSKEDYINSRNAIWNERWYTEGRILKEKSVEKHIRNLVMGAMANSDTDHKYKTQLVDDTVVIAKRMFNLMKLGKVSEASRIAWDHASNMIEDVDFINDEMFNQYKELRDYLRTTPIAIPEQYKADTDWSAIRRQNRGRIRISNSGVMIDKVYQELQERYPEFFNEEQHDHPADQLQQISDVLDSIQPYKEAYTSEEAAGLIGDIASNLWDIVYEAEEYKSIADTFKEKFDRRTKAMKLRHQEALAKVRENAANQVQREKTRHREYVERQRNMRDHAKHYGSIESNYDWLAQRLLNPTKEKNIPEEARVSLAKMLQFFDLQTERSKQLEEITGRTAQKTLNMREVQARLKDIAQENDGFEIDANLEYMMEAMANKLDGKSIDAMDMHDIATVDTLLKAIRHQFQRMNQIRLDNKRIEISEIGNRVISDMADRIEQRGEGKTYGGIRGALDMLINMEEVTPVYFFEKLGAMNNMYGQLRKAGFDTYVRNTRMINERMEEILGPYYNVDKKGRATVPGSILDTWQDDSNAKTFNLTHGDITLSPAQMMSLYCLSKREQAMGHMLAGGIVVTPIQTGSKVEAAKESWKGKVENVNSIRLTEADIQQIVEQLTPEQVRVAEQLQAFMTNEMAELGNEAHMELYGYKAFKDPNYFPIKVHGNEIAMDINNIGDVIEKIKSFGPAKPVVPGASNKIVVDNIFDVVADHCNGMNLYNSYLVPISDFMRVYNYRQYMDDGSTLTVRDAIQQAYTDKALTYINNFMKDINGIKADNRGGMDQLMNSALGKAKTAAVFGNVRVFLQQPTAITRAFAVMDPKYFKNAKASKENMAEMFDNCPIAYWKSLGNYEMFMGRDIKDVMMNNWSRSDKALSEWYGIADNRTWSMIWDAVKNEVAETHPEVERGSQEFLDLCGERMSYVVDKTQVVDSAFHRSNLMRNKQVYAKIITSFMAEPTLTFNVLRDGIVRAHDSWQAGDKSKASQIIGRTAAVLMAQQLTVSIAQAIVDAWRGKRPKLPWEDEEDLIENMTKDQLIEYAKKNGIAIPEKAKKAEILEAIQNAEHTPGIIGMFERYNDRLVRNIIANFFENGRYWNNIYGVKELTPLMDYGFSKITEDSESAAVKWLRSIMGWDQEYLYSNNNILINNWYQAAKGFGKMVDEARKENPEGDIYDRYYDSFQKFSSGIAAITGLPVPTLMRDTKPIWDKLREGMVASAADEIEEMNQAVPTTTTEKPKQSSVSESESGEVVSETTSQKSTKGGFAESIMAADSDGRRSPYYVRLEYAEKSVEGLTGEARKDKLWDVVSTGYIQDIEEGNYVGIQNKRRIIEQLGGDVEYFDQRVFAETKKAYKKSLVSLGTNGNYSAPAESQSQMYQYLVNNGMTAEEISSEILYKSYMAKDLKAALRLGNQQYIMDELVPLIAAGLTEEDFNKLYKYRNRYQNYQGKYANITKSSGKYSWPITGTITSEYGYRGTIAGLNTNPYHYGIDIAGNTGDPIGAADGGTVVSVGWNGGLGNSVVIRHDDGTETIYSHMSAFCVHEGDTVAQGQEIGQVGSTGQSTGPHLDFRVRVNGEFINPMEYLS